MSSRRPLPQQQQQPPPPGIDSPSSGSYDDYSSYSGSESGSGESYSYTGSDDGDRGSEETGSSYPSYSYSYPYSYSDPSSYSTSESSSRDSRAVPAMPAPQRPYPLPLSPRTPQSTASAVQSGSMALTMPRPSISATNMTSGMEASGPINSTRSVHFASSVDEQLIRSRQQLSVSRRNSGPPASSVRIQELSSSASDDSRSTGRESRESGRSMNVSSSTSYSDSYSLGSESYTGSTRSSVSGISYGYSDDYYYSYPSKDESLGNSYSYSYSQTDSRESGPLTGQTATMPYASSPMGESFSSLYTGTTSTSSDAVEQRRRRSSHSLGPSATTESSYYYYSYSSGSGSNPSSYTYSPSRGSGSGRTGDFSRGASDSGAAPPSQSGSYTYSTLDYTEDSRSTNMEEGSPRPESGLAPHPPGEPRTSRRKPRHRRSPSQSSTSKVSSSIGTAQTSSTISTYAYEDEESSNGRTVSSSGISESATGTSSSSPLSSPKAPESKLLVRGSGAEGSMRHSRRAPRGAPAREIVDREVVFLAAPSSEQRSEANLASLPRFCFMRSGEKHLDFLSDQVHAILAQQIAEEEAKRAAEEQARREQQKKDEKRSKPSKKAKAKETDAAAAPADGEKPDSTASQPDSTSAYVPIPEGHLTRLNTIAILQCLGVHSTADALEPVKKEARDETPLEPRKGGKSTRTPKDDSQGQRAMREAAFTDRSTPVAHVLYLAEQASLQVTEKELRRFVQSEDLGQCGELPLSVVCELLRTAGVCKGTVGDVSVALVPAYEVAGDSSSGSGGLWIEVAQAVSPPGPPVAVTEGLPRPPPPAASWRQEFIDPMAETRVGDSFNPPKIYWDYERGAGDVYFGKRIVCRVAPGDDAAFDAIAKHLKSAAYVAYVVEQNTFDDGSGAESASGPAPRRRERLVEYVPLLRHLLAVSTQRKRSHMERQGADALSASDFLNRGEKSLLRETVLRHLVRPFSCFAAVRQQVALVLSLPRPARIPSVLHGTLATDAQRRRNVVPLSTPDGMKFVSHKESPNRTAFELRIREVLLTAVPPPLAACFCLVSVVTESGGLLPAVRIPVKRVEAASKTTTRWVFSKKKERNEVTLCGTAKDSLYIEACYHHPDAWDGGDGSLGGWTTYSAGFMKVSVDGLESGKVAATRGSLVHRVDEDVPALQQVKESPNVQATPTPSAPTPGAELNAAKEPTKAATASSGVKTTTWGGFFCRPSAAQAMCFEIKITRKGVMEALPPVTYMPVRYVLLQRHVQIVALLRDAIMSFLTPPGSTASSTSAPSPVRLSTIQALKALPVQHALEIAADVRLLDEMNLTWALKTKKWGKSRANDVAFQRTQLLLLASQLCALQNNVVPAGTAAPTTEPPLDLDAKGKKPKDSKPKAVSRTRENHADLFDTFHLLLSATSSSARDRVAPPLSDDAAREALRV